MALFVGIQYHIGNFLRPIHNMNSYRYAIRPSCFPIQIPKFTDIQGCFVYGVLNRRFPDSNIIVPLLRMNL